MTEVIALGQIILIDALMAADNAIVVAMAAASVPVEKRRMTIILGTAAAVVLRIGFALIAVQLLQIVGLLLAGGLLLAYVAYDMYRELRRHREEEHLAVEEKKDMSIWRAVGLVIVADVSMSLDNVLAVAGAANGHTGVLVTGLVISVTLMAVAASTLASLIKKHRWIAWVGLVMILYVALSMIWHGSQEVMTIVVR